MKHRTDRLTTFLRRLVIASIPLLLAACSDTAWNNPYPEDEQHSNVLYSEFSERPKHLDPVRSYVSNEYELIGQIYEPPVQYHYLKRPYELVPLAATSVPTPRYLDAQRRPLPDNAAAADIAYSVYEITIKPGIRYQPHPAFARDGEQFRYHDLDADTLETIYTLADFEHTDSRELTAADYVYEIKRLAHPKLNCPIFGLMSDYIVGLKDYAKSLDAAYQALAEINGREEGNFLDLNNHDLAGAEVVDRYTYRITIRGKYPQFVYWLAMPFFAPMPWEADRFYSQPGLIEKNITLDWYPVGTGPYMLTENNPNLRMVMVRNPNFHGETYPTEGEPEDTAAGLLKDAGKPMPFIDKVVYNLEKETIPYWNKFLQGYYDTSGVASDSFDQAIQFTAAGDAALTDAMQEKGIELVTAVTTSISYMGFNWLDPLLGGASKRARKLRQAIAIAVDMEELISIFANGRGIPAQGPVPPGIFGHVAGEAGINPYIYDWVNGKPKRKPIAAAKKLLAEAGYPNGIDPKTGKRLLINFDTALSGPGAKSYLDWLVKQFRKINIQLVIRNTDFNRFQQKADKGSLQFFRWGWNADYPDPENFLFLFYGPNKRIAKHGENAVNYENAEFDRLFEKMKAMDNSPERQAIVSRMVAILQRDAPWLFGYIPVGFSLHHGWYTNIKPNLMANNTLKYKRIDPELRAEKRAAWNKPVLWPLYLTLVLLVALLLPGIFSYIRKEHRAEVEQ
jgi:oligopeptide transport system substrate-binding protein